jgi:hypothetical protein
MKPKQCKTCKTKFTPDRQFQQTCSFDCAIGLVKFNQAKKAKKDWVKEKAERKEKITTLSEWKGLLQIVINQIVRLIDNNVGCIATGAKTGKFNAGHYVSRGSNDTIRFNLHNIFLQSEHSNSYNSGDTIRFQEGLKKIYGLDYFEYVESLRNTKPLHLTIETIKEKIIIAKLIRKELIELGNTYTAAERIHLRFEYNDRIGIYLERL